MGNERRTSEETITGRKYCQCSAAITSKLSTFNYYTGELLGLNVTITNMYAQVTSVATQERNSSPKATETSTGQVTVSVGVTTTAVVTITGPKSWSSVTMGRKQQGS